MHLLRGRVDVSHMTNGTAIATFDDDNSAYFYRLMEGKSMCLDATHKYSVLTLLSVKESKTLIYYIYFCFRRRHGNIRRS